MVKIRLHWFVLMFSYANKQDEENSVLVWEQIICIIIYDMYFLLNLLLRLLYNLLNLESELSKQLLIKDNIDTVIIYLY